MMALHARDTSQRRHELIQLPFRAWGTPILVILSLTALIFLIAFWMDQLTVTNDAQQWSIDDLLHQLTHQDVDQARNTLGGLGEVMAAVLGLALTVSSIIVQLAATRFTPYITALFFRAQTNLVILGFFVVSAVFVVWMNFSIGEHVPRWGVFIAMVLMTMSLLLLFPYFNYVFDFLDPEKIVSRISRDGLDACTSMGGKPDNLEIRRRQERAIEAIEHLANISLNAMQQKDKNIAFSAVDALCNFAILYGQNKASMGLTWPKIQPWNRQSPDFVSLSSDAIQELEDRQTWLEWKILRQYQMLFSEGLDQIKDVCYLISINTRRLGDAACVSNHISTLDLAIKFFNTYMRAALNAMDVRTAYNILHQYRQLAERVLYESENPNATGNKAIDIENRRKRVVEIAMRMRYYGGLAFQKKMAFLTEVVAHDLGGLCGLAFPNPEAKCACHDDLLRVFLGVDDTTETDSERSLRGVRLAQVKLATAYLYRGGDDLAKQIADDMENEPRKRLRSIWQELASVTDREFWEVQDRGSNFNYLPPEHREMLPDFFALFPGLTRDGDDD